MEHNPSLGIVFRVRGSFPFQFTARRYSSTSNLTRSVPLQLYFKVKFHAERAAPALLQSEVITSNLTRNSREIFRTLQPTIRNDQ